MAVNRSNRSRSPWRSPPVAAAALTDFERHIYDRIASRLGSRVRNLGVSVAKGSIHLTGQCSTFYSKQLAQHAVLGIVEDEVIKNDIDVMVPTPTGGMG